MSDPFRIVKIETRRHIGSTSCCTVFKPPCSGDGSRSGDTVQHARTKTATRSWFHFFAIGCCCIESEGGALVDSLEALSVLHRHEELLSQVLEGFVAGQIQAVKTEKKKGGKNDRFTVKILINKIKFFNLLCAEAGYQV